jgi:hypothetical protein
LGPRPEQYPGAHGEARVEGEAGKQRSILRVSRCLLGPCKFTTDSCMPSTGTRLCVCSGTPWAQPRGAVALCLRCATRLPGEVTWCKKCGFVEQPEVREAPFVPEWNADLALHGASGMSDKSGEASSPLWRWARGAGADEQDPRSIVRLKLQP